MSSHGFGDRCGLGAVGGQLGESRVGERVGVVFHPRDLKGPLVEHAATRKLRTPGISGGGLLPHLFPEVPHPLDRDVHDVDAGSTPYASSSDRNRGVLSVTPVGSPCARHFSSLKNGA